MNVSWPDFIVGVSHILRSWKKRIALLRGTVPGTLWPAPAGTVRRFKQLLWQVDSNRCTAGRHDLALQQVRSTLPASRASRKFVLLPAQSTLARFISALLVGGVSITWPKTPRSVARIKLANEVGGDQRHHQPHDDHSGEPDAPRCDCRPAA